eukprot:gene8672-9555_t
MEEDSHSDAGNFPEEIAHIAQEGDLSDDHLELIEDKQNLDQAEDDSKLPCIRKRRLLKKAPDAPKRFKSAYICFVTEKMEDVKKELPPDKKVTDIMKVLAYMWRNLPPLEKHKYESIADADKSRYFEELSHYSGPLQVPNTRQKKPPGAPKRAMSAFLSFSQVMRPLIRAEHPDLKNTDISGVLAERWRNAKEEEKRPHLDRELREREKYHDSMAKWRQEEESRRKEESELKKQKLRTTIDFLDLPSDMWDSIEVDSNSYGNMDCSNEEMQQINNMLADAVENEEPQAEASIGARDKAVNSFWDRSNQQQQQQMPQPKSDEHPQPSSSSSLGKDSGGDSSLSTADDSSSRKKKRSRSSRNLINTARWRDPQALSASTSSMAPPIYPFTYVCYPAPPVPASSNSGSLPSSACNLGGVQYNGGPIAPNSTFANYPYTMPNWYGQPLDQRHLPTMVMQQAVSIPHVNYSSSAQPPVPFGEQGDGTHSSARVTQTLRSVGLGNMADSNKSKEDKNNSSMYASSQQHRPGDLQHTLWAVHSMYP